MRLSDPRYKPLIVLAFSFLPYSLEAKKLEIEPSISASSTYYNSDLENGSENTDNRVYSLKPKLSIAYSGNHASAFFNADHLQVEREKEIEDSEDGFTDFGYGGQLELLENSLILTLSGQLDNQPTGTRGSFVSDPLLNSGELAKTRTNSANLIFSIPNPQLIGLDWQLGYSKSESDRQSSNENNLDNDNYTLRSQVYNGESINTFSWNVFTSYSNTSRQQSSDIKARAVDARLGIKINRYFEVIGVTNRDEYELDISTLNGSFSELDTVSYGAGISFLGKQSNRIDVTYNTLDEAEEETDYFGIDIDWRLSQRTDFSFSYGKRFFGDAFDFSLTYNLKNLRVTGLYSEDVTTIAQVNNTSENLGVLVCPSNSFELTECFQPSSLNYELSVNEVFTSITVNDFELNQEAQLNKTGSLAISYSLRKLTSNLTVRNSDIDFLETGRTRKNQSINWLSTYQVGAKTTANLNAQFSRREFSEDDATDDTITVTVGMDHQLSRKLSISLDYRHLDRDSSDNAFTGKDNRITTELTYQF